MLPGPAAGPNLSQPSSSDTFKAYAQIMPSRHARGLHRHRRAKRRRCSTPQPDRQRQTADQAPACRHDILTGKVERIPFRPMRRAGRSRLTTACKRDLALHASAGNCPYPKMRRRGGTVRSAHPPGKGGAKRPKWPADKAAGRIVRPWPARRRAAARSRNRSGQNHARRPRS